MFRETAAAFTYARAAKASLAPGFGSASMMREHGTTICN
jgi:hypothetical protein